MASEDDPALCRKGGSGLGLNGCESTSPEHASPVNNRVAINAARARHGLAPTDRACRVRPVRKWRLLAA